MGAVHFYHLTSSPMERALPKLLEKAYAGGFRTIVLAEDEEKVDRLNTILWTYEEGSFLPHGSAKDAEPEKQPIFLTSTPPETGGEKQILCITSGQLSRATDAFERVLDIFDGSHDDQLSAARARWKIYKEQGVSLVYHQQTESGGWQQKATA